MYEIINKVEKELGIRILRLNKCNNGVSNLVYRISTSKNPTYILDNISLDISKGDYISIIGDNGSR